VISDLLDSFDFDMQKAIIDNYQLKDGLYVKVGKQVEYFIYKKVKDGNKEVGLKDLYGNIKVNEYEWFVIRDYLSVYLNSNKAIDPPKKKIHNNNYLTLFVKAKEFNKNNKDHFVNKLYENLKNFALFSKKEEIKVLKSFKEYIFSEKRQKDIEEKKKKFLEFFDDILDKKELIKEGEYIKIFFDEDVKKYENEAKIYYALKIYNKIETVKDIDGEIFGLSDFNMGLNAKKPYLEHKTRGFSLPFMVKKDEIFKIKELFDFLKYQKNILEVPATNNKRGIFLVKHSNNDQAEIEDFDIVVKDKKLNKKIVIRNYLKFEGEDEEIDTLDVLFNKIDEIFYNGYLKNNLFGEVYSKLSNDFQYLIYLTRDAMLALKKGEITPLLKVNKKFANEFVILYLRKGDLFKAKDVLNLKLSLLEYEGEKMDIKKSLENLEKKINSLEELNDEEFFLLSGQIIRYLLNQSEKSDKKADMMEPFLRAGKSKKLKQDIEMLYFNYKHKIPLNFPKLNNAMSLVMAFDKDIKTSKFKDKLLVGILSENIFYKKDS